MRYYAKPPNRDDDGDYQGGDGGDVDSVADDDWDDTPSSRVAFTGGGEKFRLENFWQFAEIMGIKREYSLRVLSGKSLRRSFLLWLFVSHPPLPLSTIAIITRFKMVLHLSSFSSSLCLSWLL